MIGLTPVDLSTVAVSTTGTIDLSTLGLSSDPSLQKNRPTLYFHNDSGCALFISFAVGMISLNLPAGAWIPVQIVPGESTINYTCTAIIGGAAISMLFINYFAPGEEVPTVNVGNSPTGIGIRPLLDIFNNSSVDVHASGHTFALIVNDFSSLTVFIDFAGFTGGTSPGITFEVDFQDATGNWFKMSNLAALTAAGLQTFLFGEGSGALPMFIRVAWTVTGAPAAASAAINAIGR